MTSCENVSNELIEFLKGRQNGQQVSMSKDLKEHIASCEDCKALVDKPSEASMLLRFRESLVALAKEASYNVMFNKITPWQVCKFYYDDNYEVAFGLVRNAFFTGKNDDFGTVCVTPLILNYNKLEVTEKDITINSDESPMGLPLLIEAWNDIVELDISQIETCYGCIGNNFRSFVNNYEPEEEHNLNETVKTFRAFEKHRASYFSEIKVNDLSESIKEFTNSSKTSIITYQTDENRIRLAAASHNDFDFLKRIYKNNFKPRFENVSNYSVDLMDNNILISNDNKNDFIITFKDVHKATTAFESINGKLRLTIEQLSVLDSFNFSLVEIIK